MDFSLSKEHEMARNLYREFAQKEVKPLAQEVDETEQFPKETVAKMQKLGFLSIPMPKEYGGQGCDTLCYAMCVEELSKVCATTGVIVSAHTSLCAEPIRKWGTEEQKQKYLVPLCNGTKLGAFGLTEPGAGTDASGQQTKAVLDGDEYVINGSKIFITNGKEADTYVIFAMTDKSKGTKGISAFIVEKGTPGFTFGTKEKKMGIRGSDTHSLLFTDVKVPKENRIGADGFGFAFAMNVLNGGRIGIASQALGIATGAYEIALKYAQERKAFGTEIFNHQAIAFKLADMYVKVTAAKLLVMKAACEKDEGKDIAHSGAMAKLYTSEIALEVANEAVQIHGGNGYVAEYHVERMMRDSKITQIYEGTNQVQRMVISGAILR